MSWAHVREPGTCSKSSLCSACIADEFLTVVRQCFSHPTDYPIVFLKYLPCMSTYI